MTKLIKLSDISQKQYYQFVPLSLKHAVNIGLGGKHEFLIIFFFLHTSYHLHTPHFSFSSPHILLIHVSRGFQSIHTPKLTRVLVQPLRYHDNM